MGRAKKYSLRQIVNLLQQIEVGIATMNTQLRLAEFSETSLSQKPSVLRSK